jgi:hypothetical protein
MGVWLCYVENLLIHDTCTVHVICVSFLDVSKLQKATISFVMTVCLSIYPTIYMEQLSFHFTDFHQILYLGIF